MTTSKYFLRNESRKSKIILKNEIEISNEIQNDNKVQIDSQKIK